MDLITLARKMRDEGHFETVTRNPMNQFGDRNRNVFYLGATYLPEINSIRGNKYREEDIAFRPVIADDSTRYGTPMLKGRTEHVYMDVEYGNIDARRAIEAHQMDSLNYILMNQGEAAARVEFLRIIRLLGEVALREKKELKRWQTIRNGYGRYLTSGNIDKIEQPWNPPVTHRYDAGVDISDGAIDPIETVIEPAIAILRDSGYECESIVCRDRPKRALANNPNTKENASSLTVTTSLQLAYNRIQNPDTYLDPFMSNADLPPIVTYDGYYYTQSGQKHFLEDTELIFFGRTPRIYPLSDPEQGRLLQFNNLGYYGIGTCQNRSSPGDVIKIKIIDDDKPDKIEVIADSTSSPIIQDPEAIVVVSNVFNTP